MRIVTITEAYLDSLSVQEVTRTVPPSPMTTRIISSFETSTTTTWRQREQSFKDHHAVRLDKCARYKDLKAAIEVRNSVAHGYGRVTAFQRRNSQLAAEVGRIAVTVSDGRMHLADSTVPAVAALCTEFVYDVDAKVPSP